MQSAGGDWVAERLAEIEGIPEAYKKANALVDLAADMVLSRRDILREAFDTAFSIEDEKAKASTLGEILSYLGEIPSELVEQARTIIERLPSGAGRSRALGAVASHLPEPERLVLLKRALNDLQVNEEGLLQIGALDTIAPQLSGDTPDLLKQALDIIGAVQDGDFPAYLVKSMALRAVAPQLREAPLEYLQQALEIVDNVQIESDKVSVLTKVASQLSAAFPEGLETALDIVSGIQREYERADALCAIAPQLQGAESELIQRAFELAQNIRTDRLFRIEVLSTILSQLDEGDRLATLQQLPIIVQEINDESDRVKALCVIAPHLNQSDRLSKLQQAFDLAQRIEDDFKRAKALCTVAPCLRESDRLAALHQSIDALQGLDDDQRTEILGAITSQLSEAHPNLIKRVFDFSQSLKSDTKRFDALVLILEKLGGTDSTIALKAIATAKEFQDNSEYFMILISAAFWLINLDRQSIIKQALVVAKTIQNKSKRAEALSAIALWLNEYDRLIAVEKATAAQVLQRQYKQANILSAIASLPNRDEYDRSAILKQALDIAKTIQDDLKCTLFIENISLHIDNYSPELLEQAIDIAQAIQNESHKSDALAAVSHRLDPMHTELIQELLDRILKISEKSLRIKALSAIAPQLSEEKRKSVLEQTLKDIEESVQEGYFPMSKFTEFSSQLAKSTPALVGKVLDITQKISDPSEFIDALSAIVPHIGKDASNHLKQAREAASNIQNRSLRVTALSIIELQLDEGDYLSQIEQLLNASQAIQDSNLRSRVLQRAVPQVLDPEKLVLQFPKDRISLILNLVEAQAADDDKVRLLSSVVPHLPTGLFPTALNLVVERVIEEDQLRVEALKNLAPYLPPEQMAGALKLCHSDKDAPLNDLGYLSSLKTLEHRAEALVYLLPYLASLNQYEAAYKIAKELFPDHRLKSVPAAKILTAFATELSAERASIIVSKTRQSLNLSKQEKTLTPQDRFLILVSNVFELARKIEGDEYMRYRARIICHLIPAMSLEQIDDQVFPALKQLFRYQSQDTVHGCIEDSGYIAQVVNAITARCLNLGDSDRAHSYITLIQNDSFGRAIALSQLSVLAATEATIKIDPELFLRKTEALIEFSKHSSRDDCQYLALRQISRLDRPALRCQYLQRLIPHLQKSQRFEAARIAKGINQGYHRTQALVTLACKFPEFRSDAKAAAFTLTDIVQKVEQLSLLAVEIPELLSDIINILNNTELSTSFHNQSPNLAAQLDATSESSETDSKPNQDWVQNLRRKRMLTTLAPHLPLRINHEVARTLGCPEDLWHRALYLLARGYRDALQGGTLRNESVQAEDLLNLKDEVNALADLLLMRDLEPPMAVGILGGWGGGKSYIMHLMQQHMTEVRSRAIRDTEAWHPDPNHESLSPYVGHIYQIKFDAWTFAKSNLWASLMQTIFFELDRQITLEKRILSVLNAPEAKLSAEQRQRIEEKVWPVLYQAKESDRQWFLKHVLTDPNLSEKLGSALDNSEEGGTLWKIFCDSQSEATERYHDLKTKLVQKKDEREEKVKKVRSEVQGRFQTLTAVQDNKVFQSIDTILGTSSIILGQRIGEPLTKKLNNKVIEKLEDCSEERSEDGTPGKFKLLSDTVLEYEDLGKKISELEDELEEVKETAATSEGVEVTPEKGNLEDSDELLDKEKKIRDQLNREKAEASKRLRKIEQTKFDIFNIAARVIDQEHWRIQRDAARQWARKNFVLLIAFLILFAVPIVLLVWISSNPEMESATVARLRTWLTSGELSLDKLAALIAYLTPFAVTGQGLLKNFRKWFEETQLALTEYRKGVEQRTQKLTETIERNIEAELKRNGELQTLDAEISELESQLKIQEASLPQNTYASLADFVTNRLQEGGYEKQLGLMQQVKCDLADLSDRLLPPKQADLQQWAAKLENLQEIFPRGPARVIVYIDDLDRCPPRRVVQVLEAVQLLVKTPLFIAVLAIDERYITRALEQYYKGVLIPHGRPSGTDYLEKIIQLPYRVRPIMPEAVEAYLKAQVVIQDNASGGSKFSEFTRQEFEMLAKCCRQTDLSPRTLKRLTNVYKLFKVVCRTRGTKPSQSVQQAILALLALSGRYPNLMRGIFNDIETCYEEKREATEDLVKQGRHKIHLDSPLQDVFEHYVLPPSQGHLARELVELHHDALQTKILPSALTLKEMGHEIFNLIRSFSFVGEIGEDPEDYGLPIGGVTPEVN